MVLSKNKIEQEVYRCSAFEVNSDVRADDKQRKLFRYSRVPGSLLNEEMTKHPKFEQNK